MIKFKITDRAIDKLKKMIEIHPFMSFNTHHMRFKIDINNTNVPVFGIFPEPISNFDIKIDDAQNFNNLIIVINKTDNECLMGAAFDFYENQFQKVSISDVEEFGHIVESPPKNWKDIKGYFDFQNVYDKIFDVLNKDSIFVELGTYKGKSAAYMLEKCVDKPFRFYVVDVWDTLGRLNPLSMSKYKFVNNIISCFGKIPDNLHIIQQNSSEAASEFDNNIIDAVFIDGDHSYEGCLKDLIYWLPKVKKGGIIAGHDYNTFDGVKKAVKVVLKDNFEIIENCFYSIKE